MRIGIDCRLWNETGVGRYTRNLVQNLLLLDAKNIYVLFGLTKDLSDIKHQLSSAKYPKYTFVAADIRWHSVKEQIMLPHILNKENLDLVHFPYFSVPILYKRPYVVTIHDLIINTFNTGKATTLPQPLYQLKRAGYNYVLSTAVKNAKKIIVPLDTVKKDVLKTFTIDDKKIVITHEGVDHNLESRAKILDLHIKNYFLYVGNAYPHKNLDRLVDAFLKYKKENKSDMQLVLVGKNDYFYKKLHEKAEADNWPDIYFKHGIPDSELAWLYAHAVAFISPSLMEGFGLPPLEAMASSCMVVLSDVPSFREVCGDVGFYFDPQSIDDIKEKMKLVSSLDPQSKREHIERGLSRAKDFSWEKMAKETLTAYESSISLR